MAQTLAPFVAPFAALILLTGCFKAADDDEIGGTDESASDSTDESASNTESSTTTDTATETDTSSEDTTTGPMCGPGETECGPVCAVLDSDPEHCGACGHSCLGGECTAGVCGPVELASGKGRLFMALVDADYIYYGGDGVDVGRMKKDGTNDMILKAAGATNEDKEWCYQSAITNNAVVWGNDWVQPGVRGCVTPDCAGGVQTFVGGLNMVAMTYNKPSDILYWNQGSDIFSRSWPGGAAGVYVASPGVPRSLATDPDGVYWSAMVAPNDLRIFRAPVGVGAVPVELVGSRPELGDIEVGPEYVYWVEGSQINFVPLVGGMPAPFGVSNQSIRFMAIDATHLYWTTSDIMGGGVQRCPLAGCAGQPEVVASAVQPWGITLDPTAVYWVTEVGTIHKIAK